MLSEKKSLEEEIISLSHKQNDWFEPFTEWVKDAQSLDKITSDSDLFAKKVCAKKIFGSHLFLGEKTLRPAEGGNPNSFGKMGGNQWDALRASHLLALKKPLSSISERAAPQSGEATSPKNRESIIWCCNYTLCANLFRAEIERMNQHRHRLAELRRRD